MSIGPVEIIIVKFPGNELHGDFGDLAPALKELVDNGIVRVIDLVLVRKDADGQVFWRELTSLDESDFNVFEPLVDDILGLISDDDIQTLSDLLENNSAGGIMLFENVWATKFSDSLLAANGQVVYNERVPRAVIDEVLAQAPAASA